MLGLAVKKGDEVEECRSALAAIHTKVSKARGEAQKAEAEHQKAYRRANGYEQCDEGLRLESEAALPKLHQRALETASKVKAIEPEQTKAEAALRAAVDAERKAGLKQLVERMFKLSQPAERVAAEVQAYLEETSRLGGSPPSEHPCPPLLVGFEYQRLYAKQNGLL